ncbi:MAG: hypothetical protein J6L83_05560 [Clostridia bacterium]|nr:hypothetical protein [Clostridia bacterium]
MKDKDTFDPYDVKAGDAWEKDKKKAEEYIFRIRWGVERFGRFTKSVKPTVFMSGDVLAVIGRVTEEIQCFYPGNKYLICGCPLKITTGENELYIALDLLGSFLDNEKR